MRTLWWVAAGVAVAGAPGVAAREAGSCGVEEEDGCLVDESAQLQLRAGASAVGQVTVAGAAQRVGEVGRVEGVWTFGRAGVSKKPLDDEVHGGCFPGLHAIVTYHSQPDPASVALEALRGYKVGKGKALELRIDKKDYAYHDCDRPMNFSTNPLDWCKNPMTCHKTDYEYYFLDNDRMPSDGQGVLKDAIKLTWDMHYFYAGDYDVHYLATSAKTRGWELVSRIKAEGWFWKDYDTVNMYQQPQTLECLLVFECTEPGDWHAILTWTNDEWCGHSGVHSGFVHEIRTITGSSEWQSQIKPKLGSCSKVHTTGHSMGGTLAEMLAYCANKKAPPLGATKSDFEQVTWIAEQPKMLQPWSEQCIKPFTRYDTDPLPFTEPVETASAEACQHKCKQTFGCAYFSWTKTCMLPFGAGCDFVQNTFKYLCTLHDSSSVALNGERGTISSGGPKSCLAETLPCVQGGLRWTPVMSSVGAETPEKCQQLCNRTTGCAHFSWTEGYFWSAAACELSGPGARPAPYAGALAGPPDCARAWTCLEPMRKHEPELESEGRSVAETAWGCQKRCQNTMHCYHFSRWSDGGCHLAGKDAVPVRDEKVIGGPARCPEMPYPDAVRQ